MSDHRTLVLAFILIVGVVGSGAIVSSGTQESAPLANPEPVQAAEFEPSEPGGEVPDDAADIRFEDAGPPHERGLTDDQVAVGVIGTGFDPDHESIADRVAGHRTLDEPPGLFGTGHRGHDTAVAEVVAQTATEADLYLAAVGQEPTPNEYRAAVEWLVANDVDVIVDAGSYFPRTAAGREQLAEATRYAADNGVVFVTSAGNYADSHWRGSSDERGWVEFADGSEANVLGNGTVSGEVTLRLYWEGAADYDLYLFRNTPGSSDQLVAKSARREGNAEAIDVVVPEGDYYVAIYNHGGTSAAVDLFAANYEFEYTDPQDSTVAPASGEGIILVGATDSDGQYQPYSSRTVDLAAPDGVLTDTRGRFRGTSAAAPLVAGTVARVQARNDTLSPAETERLLERTATTRDGVPQIDTEAAIQAVSRNESETTPRLVDRRLR